jgi:general secretion pathway protein A
LFTAGAIDLIHDTTGGVPRLINLVCDTALVFGFAQQMAAIGPDLIEHVVEQRAAGGLLPLRYRGNSASTVSPAVG